MVPIFSHLQGDFGCGAGDAAPLCFCELPKSIAIVHYEQYYHFHKGNVSISQAMVDGILDTSIDAEVKQMAKQVSSGKCYLCGRTLNKAVMTRHLGSCIDSHADSVTAGKPQIAKQKTQNQKLFRIAVEGRYEPQYWMHLEVPARATLSVLDDFLRRTWLECCGHLSAFRIGTTSFGSYPMDEMDDEGMDIRLGRLLDIGMKFSHEYDFGSTTELALKVVSVREEKADANSVVRLLARNEAPSIACISCGGVASEVCTECAWSGGGWLCDHCAEEHECGEEMLLPVVNSPRVGVCGYSGQA